jgi:glutamine amidotransferase
MRVLVMDYGKGNVRSIIKGLEQTGVEVDFSDQAAAVRAASAIVLPGVGTFADAAGFMERSGQMDALREVLADGRPFLGICLGIQLLMERGEEGVLEVNSRTEPDASWMAGAGMLAGYCQRLRATDSSGRQFKIPHVGWNQVHFVDGAEQKLEPLFAGIEDGSNFYFTHSYRTVLADRANLLAEVVHAESFPAVVRAGNAFGVQFHPEKSSRKGLSVLKNFVHFAGRC